MQGCQPCVASCQPCITSCHHMLMAMLCLFCYVQAFLAALVSWRRVRLVDHQAGIRIQHSGYAPATPRICCCVVTPSGRHHRLDGLLGGAGSCRLRAAGICVDIGLRLLSRLLENATRVVLRHHPRSTLRTTYVRTELVYFLRIVFA